MIVKLQGSILEIDKIHTQNQIMMVAQAPVTNKSLA
jgi:hypothetical protein